MATLPFWNTFEGLAEGVSITPASSGGASGTAIGNVQQTWTAQAAAAWKGNRGAQRVLDGNQGYLRLDVADAVGRQAVRVPFFYPGTPAGTSTVVGARRRDSPADQGTTSVQILSTGLPQMTRTNASTGIIESRPGASPFMANEYHIITAYVEPTGEDGMGFIGYQILDADEQVLHEWESPTEVAIGTDLPSNAWRVGALTSAQWAAAEFWCDELGWGPLASGFPGPQSPALPLTIGSPAMYAHFPVETSEGATITVDHLSGPDHSGGAFELVREGDLYVAIPLDTAGSSYRLEVAVGSATSDDTINVPALSSALPSGAIRRRIWDGEKLI